MLLEISGEITPERMKLQSLAPPKKKKKFIYIYISPVVDVTDDRSKV